jgi:hypothetical protein
MHILEGWGRHNARGAPNPCCHNSQPTRKERPDSSKRLEGTLSAIATEHGAPNITPRRKRIPSKDGVSGIFLRQIRHPELVRLICAVLIVGF